MTNKFNNVMYKIEDDGLDYTFQHYSDWEEIDDPIFHTLRKQYIAAAAALDAYVRTKKDDSGWLSLT